MANENTDIILNADATHSLYDFIQSPYATLSQNPAAQYLLTLRSEQSRAAMTRNIQSVANIFGIADVSTIKWEDMRHTDVQLFIVEAQKRNLSPNTINTYLSAIRGVAKQAWLSKGLSTDDYQRIKEVRALSGKRLPSGRALDRSELRALFESCDEDKNRLLGVRDAAIIALMVGCGFRRSEIVSINMNDVNKTKGTVKVMGKGSKERSSSLPNQLLPRLEDWLIIRQNHQHNSEDPFFIRVRRHQSITCERLSPQAVYYLLNKRGVSQQIENISPHDLRRTFATALFDNGQDIRTVQIALGHENIETTKVYDKSGENRKEKAVKNLNIL